MILDIEAIYWIVLHEGGTMALDDGAPPGEMRSLVGRKMLQLAAYEEERSSAR